MNTVHLQGIGKFQAKPAVELMVGDVTVWNYGAKEVVTVVEKRGKSVYVTLKYTSMGKEVEGIRRFSQTRLVAFATKKAV